MSKRVIKPFYSLYLVLFLALIIGVGGLALTPLQAPAAGDTANGTIKLKVKTVELKYAYLVKGPGSFDPNKTVSTIILTPDDISQKISECKSLSCAGGISEGMTIGKEDFGSTTRVVYWVVTKGSMMQYSGNTNVSALVLSTDKPDRMAGKLSVDDSAADGPKIDVEFDSPLAKDFKEYGSMRVGVRSVPASAMTWTFSTSGVSYITNLNLEVA